MQKSGLPWTLSLRQERLPIREGRLGLTNNEAIKGAVFIDCQASLVLGRVVIISNLGTPATSLLKRLPERSIASVFLDELKALVPGGKTNKLEAGSAGSGKRSNKKRYES